MSELDADLSVVLDPKMLVEVVRSRYKIKRTHNTVRIRLNSTSSAIYYHLNTLLASDMTAN